MMGRAVNLQALWTFFDFDNNQRYITLTVPMDIVNTDFLFPLTVSNGMSYYLIASSINIK